MTYTDFLKDKVIVAPESGFALDMARLNPALKPHQADAVAWALRGGRRVDVRSIARYMYSPRGMKKHRGMKNGRDADAACSNANRATE